MNRARARDLAGALSCGALVLIFFSVLLWHDPLLFWNDDYALSILPVFADVARSWSEGVWPLLSPYSWVCGNLAGEFQYGTFSLFVNAAVIAIWKFPLTFPAQAAALSLVHLVVLGAGGYLLGRERKLAPPLALMVGLIAALNGWIVCWGAIDWFGALGAFAWLPWAWWGAERALDPARGPRRFLWPAPFVYLLVTGGFPYTVVMLALLLGWLGWKTMVQTRRLRAVLPLLAGTLLGVGLAAPAWLALFDYMNGSAREAQEAASHWQWIVPPGAWPGLILPAWTVPWADFSTRLIPHTATELAAGMVAPAAVLYALGTRPREFVRRQRWELGLLALVFLLAMLPTASVFRWSFRWLPFLHLLLALCAAEALRGNGKRRAFSNPAVLAMFLVLGAGLAMWWLDTGGRFGWRTFLAFFALTLAWVIWEKLGRRSWAPATMTFVSLLLTYLCLPPNGGVPKYHLDQNLTQAAPLDPARLYLSVYPAPELAYRVEEKAGPVGLVVRPGSASMWGAVRFINGYSPIRPAGVARDLDVAIHGELAPWSSEFQLGWEAGPNGKLARLGVDGIIVAEELPLAPQPEAEWKLADKTEEGRVYHRRGEALPRVQSLLEGNAPNESWARANVQVKEDSRLRVVAEVAVPAGGRPALLTFSRPFFPGYRATLNGRGVAVTSWRGFVPAVELPPGSSGRLILRYRPWWLVVGSATALACAAVGLISVALGGRRHSSS